MVIPEKIIAVSRYNVCEVRVAARTEGRSAKVRGDEGHRTGCTRIRLRGPNRVGNIAGICIGVVFSDDDGGIALSDDGRWQDSQEEGIGESQDSRLHVVRVKMVLAMRKSVEVVEGSGIGVWILNDALRDAGSSCT